MTLSTKAEHERGREIDYVSDEVGYDVNPHTYAESAIIELEGSENDPTVVDDPHWQARELADSVQQDAEDLAGCYTDSQSIAESVGRRLAEDAYEAFLDGLAGSPCIEIEGEL